MKPNVFWYGDCRGSWCHAIVEWLTADCNHIPPLALRIAAPGDMPAVVVFKADHVRSSDQIADLNEFLDDFRSVLLFVTANEEGTLDPSLIHHDRMRMWIQTPTKAQRQWASCGIPWGWTPGFDGSRWSVDLPGYRADEADRMLDFSFCGQVTHHRRIECVNALEEAINQGANGAILRTSGFGQGLPKHLYFELLMNSKLVPCPSGPVTVDSFRVWEALECGAVPLVDAYSPTMDVTEGLEYWQYITGEDHPFSATADWDESIPRAIGEIKQNWAAHQNNCVDWWAARKRFWQDKFKTDLEMLQVPR